MSDYEMNMMKPDPDRKPKIKRPVLPWIPALENPPTPGSIVLATYKNSHQNSRIIIASRIPPMFEECCCEYDCNCEYDEQRDCNYYPAGWYEQIENWDDFSCVFVSEEITHWMPLPVSLKA